ncbi:hypothetical protein PROFUN_06443 [Planoprotostelium fungivorum]|uniref:Uncharacterized protein n=1 Tax=Planoprotostelium fungivorum TaxID=1890364 RepID=A0A2P6MQX9_9EUKA|nr:hypothetical protein PROFUN_06443 [Planoprotostelium fungivorum]
MQANTQEHDTNRPADIYSYTNPSTQNMSETLGFEPKYSDFTCHVAETASSQPFMGYPKLSDMNIPQVPEVKPYTSQYTAPSLTASAPPATIGDITPLPANWKPTNGTMTLPFNKTESDCEKIFYDWVSSLFLTPTGFKKAAKFLSKRYFVPFLYGNVTATVTYRCQLGRHVQNHRTGVEEMIWDVYNGYQIIPFPDVLMCADSDEEMRNSCENLNQWNISPKTITYSSLEVLRNTGLTIGTPLTTEEIWMKHTEPHIRGTSQSRCQRQTEEQKHTRYIRNFEITKMDYSNYNMNIIFLPVFFGTYYSETKPYHFLINGQNGTYHAERPPFGAGKFGDVMKGAYNLFGYITGKNNEEIVLLSGKELVEKDNQKVYEERSYFLLFPRTDPLAVGFITLTNSSAYPVEIRAQKRRGVTVGRTVTLSAGSTETYDYCGHWCIQVVRGNPKEIRVDRVETRGGGTLGDKLGILDK